MRLPAPRTLRARVTIATAIVLASVLALVAVVVDEQFRRQASAALDAALEVEVEAVASLARFEDGRLDLDFDGQGRLAGFEAPGSGAYYMVSAPGIASLLSPSLAGKSLAEPAPGTALPERQSGIAPGPHEHRIRWSLRRLTLRELSGEDDEPRPGARALPIEVRVARSTAEVDAARSRVRAGLGLALPVGLLLGTLVAYLLAGRATAPIRRLSREARAVGTRGAAGRLDIANVEGELLDLAATLNEAFGRLESTAEQERQFSAAAAHELRTPLAVLRARLEVTLSRERAPEEYRRALETALAAGARLEELTTNLLLLARMEAQDLTREPVDLREIARSALAGAARAPGQAVASLSGSPGPLFVQGNAVLLERLVAGLVENARTHGGDADVRVVLGREGAAATLEVLDSGPGFPASLMPRLFERFARGEASRSRATGGAGLGLAIARAIAGAHGGDLTARTLSEGGAAVALRLPLLSDHDVPRGSGATRAAATVDLESTG